MLLASLENITIQNQNEKDDGSETTEHDIEECKVRWCDIPSGHCLPRRLDLQTTYKPIVTVALGIENKLFLHGLQLMNQKHQDDADQERDKRGVKCHPKTVSHPGDIALDSLMGLAKGIANAAYGSDKPYCGDSPGYVSNDRKV
jgi:hypothetical protein